METRAETNPERRKDHYHINLTEQEHVRSSSISVGATQYHHRHKERSRSRSPKRESGGSSGGEGSLLGSGGSILGIGNDIGGSVRNPAIFNGIYSLKPTHGRHLTQEGVSKLNLKCMKVKNDSAIFLFFITNKSET